MFPRLNDDDAMESCERDEATSKMSKMKEAKKSWNYDDLIRKVRNNEIFLMRNFSLSLSLSLLPFVTVNWSRRVVLFLLLWVFIFSFLHNSRFEGKNLNEEEEKWGNWKKGIFHRQAGCGRKTTPVDVLFNEGGEFIISHFLLPFSFRTLFLCSLIKNAVVPQLWLFRKKKKARSSRKFIN